MAVIGVPSALALPQTSVSAFGTSSYTQVNVVKFAHVWTIINFSYLLEEGNEYLLSPTFSAGEGSDDEWQLKLYPKGDKKTDYVSLYLRLKSSNAKKVKTKFDFHIIDSQNRRNNTRVDSSLYMFHPGKSWGYNNFINRSYLLNHASDLLPNDKLTVLCEISATGGIVNFEGPNDTVKFELPERQLSQDLEHLFVSKNLSDVTLIAGGRKIRAHKSILAARSHVFSAMFNQESEEQKLNRVVILDDYLNYEVAEEMLRYIYTGTVRNLETMAEQLLPAANKYSLEELKTMCEQELYKKLNIENAADLLIVAETFGANQLKPKVVEFIRTHAKVVMGTKGFKSMANTHPHLAVEALDALLADYFEEERKITNLFQ